QLRVRVEEQEVGRMDGACAQIAGGRKAEVAVIADGDDIEALRRVERCGPVARAVVDDDSSLDVPAVAAGLRQGGEAAAEEGTAVPVHDDNVEAEIIHPMAVIRPETQRTALPDSAHSGLFAAPSTTRDRLPVDRKCRCRLPDHGPACEVWSARHPVSEAASAARRMSHAPRSRTHIARATISTRSARMPQAAIRRAVGNRHTTPG